eukprot:Gregarina_sp_Poly_1__6183@NODE_3272_length_1220_cov_216_986123_g2041_i1_p1_GENE_NODE_3272_length_1220_cov_216_986123_g2041_i1NODE_3272_length_1220_cov_216_986123_g2041_i1_p1_ORF_typecomplete_len280_score34_14Exo_endo_phos/PF03372_23/7_3e18_NODE_3272_length_1220_cov_216_986123_g2041_i1100939
MAKRKAASATEEANSSEDRTQVTKKAKYNPHEDGKGPDLHGDWKAQIQKENGGPNEFKISTWNVNGLRAIFKSRKNSGDVSDLEAYVKEEKPDVLCLNETKIDPEIERIVQEKLPKYEWHFAHSQKKGYAGVAVLLKKDSEMCKQLLSVSIGVGDPEHDTEGRSLTLIYPKLCLVASYVANAGQQLKRLDYRVKQFDPSMQEYLKGLEAKHSKPVLWCGDLNVAYEEIDIWNSRGNQKSPGHTPEERASFGAFLGEGAWVDLWRSQNPGLRRYTYWSQR